MQSQSQLITCTSEPATPTQPVHIHPATPPLGLDRSDASMLALSALLQIVITLIMQKFYPPANAK